MKTILSCTNVTVTRSNETERSITVLDGKFFFRVYALVGHDGDFFLFSFTRAPFLKPTVRTTTVV
jgi:hypothetical protein